jgi:hypothetical protein
MKLYECPPQSWVRVLEDPKMSRMPGAVKKGDVIYFGQIDGMYSYCKNKAGKTIHPALWTEVELTGN